jgi:glutaminyl-tRNA synthetase
MIDDGLAYVCTHSEEVIAASRGTIKLSGIPCDCRDRSIDENSRLFKEMEDSFEEGEAVLRAKIDLSSNNMKMRDPIMYRIKKIPHYRDGNWNIYPMYDFAHPLSDAIDEITYSICTLEFDNNRELYDWYIDSVRPYLRNFYDPKQYEMARLNLEDTVLSKRLLAKLVEDGSVSGWPDPRMPTIRGMATKGITPGAIKRFVRELGFSKADNSVASMAKFNNIIRDELNQTLQRNGEGLLRVELLD